MNPNERWPNISNEDAAGKAPPSIEGGNSDTSGQRAPSIGNIEEPGKARNNLDELLQSAASLRANKKLKEALDVYHEVYKLAAKVGDKIAYASAENNILILSQLVHSKK